MSFIAENPLIIPKVESVSPIPLGARAIFPREDGWYDINSDGVVSKIIDSNDDGLIIDISGINDYRDLLVYDKTGKSTIKWNDVHAGIFRLNCIDDLGMTRKFLLLQTVYFNSFGMCGVGQFIIYSDSLYMYRTIKDLSVDTYPDFDVFSLKPRDDLGGAGVSNTPLSAGQGYILDQKKADKEELVFKEDSSNKTSVIDDDANNSSYPTSKAVKDYVTNIVEECIQRIMNEASPIRTTTLTLYASQWIESDGMYSQTVTTDNVTPYSKIDLQPTAEQLVIFHEKDIAFVTENDNGVITVYCIGQKPTNDYIIQATITEVKNDE